MLSSLLYIYKPHCGVSGPLSHLLSRKILCICSFLHFVLIADSFQGADWACFGNHTKQMTTFDQDPDVDRWGLYQLLNVCSLSNAGSSITVTQHDPDSSQVEYIREGYCEREHVNVENDEIIAHALQEELSQIAAVEASGSSHAGEEHLQESILSQDWLGPSNRYSSYGHECVQEEDMGNFTSCSSPGEKSCTGEDLLNSPEIADESVLDGEVGKRINQMVPIPHVPKINGEIPSVDEATTDHERLLYRLQLYDLVELKVQGDGNCQFRALSDQIYRNPEHHRLVRERIVDQLKSYSEMYEGYVPMAYGDYLKKINKTGEWGDHVTLQAAADSYGVKIFVITSFKDTCYIEILPHDQKSNRVIFLSFWAEVHYNSIYPEGALNNKIETALNNKIETHYSYKKQSIFSKALEFVRKHFL